jgi:hypothetical protein
MRNPRSLHFDALEGRQLLTASHPAAHHKQVEPVTPLVLNGTLSVETAKMSEIENADGSTTTTLPVSGKLGDLGNFHGTWYETMDQYGDYEGPDTIQLKGVKGAIVIAFSNATTGKAYQSGPKSFYYQHNQILLEGSGAYKRTSESGTIELNTNASKESLTSITIVTN